MDSLGNLGTKDGEGMRIKDPLAAEALLDAALRAAKTRQRIIFYWACERPCDCHRSAVGKLPLDAATRS